MGALIGVKGKFQLWKQNLESMSFKGNLGKIKVLVNKKTEKTLLLCGERLCWIKKEWIEI